MALSDKENLEKFKYFFATDLLYLFFDIKSYLNYGGFDLLNQENNSSKNDFVEMIYKNVRFEPMEEEDLEEEDEIITY